MKKLLIALIIFLALVGPVKAQQVRLSVQPPQVEILMQPGKSLIKAFNFENRSDPGIFYFKIMSLRSSGDQGNVELVDNLNGPIKFSLENNTVALSERFFLESRKTVQAILRISAMENALEGDYYYALFLVSEPPTTQSSAGRGSAMLGANILVSVTKTGMRASTVQIAQFQIIPRYKWNFFGKTLAIVEPTDEIPVILKLANTGKYLVAPEAKLNLQGAGKRQKKDLLPQNILRSSQRLLFPRDLPECQRCQTPVSAVFHGFYLGKYRISADIGFIGQNQKIFAVTEFWALPVKALMILLGLFFAASLLLLILKSKSHE